MINSAGMVVVHYNNNEFKVLLLRAYSYWDFPKGKLEEGEGLLEAAIREVKEEAGIVDLNLNWGMDTFSTAPYSRPQKIATYFLAETFDDKVTLAINPELGKAEHDEARWLSFNEAKSISHPRIQEVLEWAEKKIKNQKKNDFMPTCK